MTHQFTYPVILAPDEDGRFVVTFPDLPYGATDGATRDEALHEAEDALEEIIASLINRNEEIPPPSAKKRSQYLVPLSAQMSAKAALAIALREAGTTKVALAKKLGCDEKEVRRMADPHHVTKLPRLEEALHALGQRLVLHVVSF